MITGLCNRPVGHSKQHVLTSCVCVCVYRLVCLSGLLGVLRVLLNLTHDHELGSFRVGEQTSVLNAVLECIFQVYSYTIICHYTTHHHSVCLLCDTYCIVLWVLSHFLCPFDIVYYAIIIVIVVILIVCVCVCVCVVFVIDSLLG